MALNGNKEKKLNKKNIAKVTILLLIIIFIITFIILYSKNEKVKIFADKYIFRKEVYEENLPMISLDGIRVDNVFAYSNYIAILNSNKLNLYNKYGNQEASIDIEISVPIFSNNGKYLCVAEKNGNKIYLISNKNVIWQNEIGGNIEDVSVNENGYVCVSISGTSYKTVIDVFDAKGDELFKTYLSSSNVIATDISKDNKYLSIAEANFSGVTIESALKIISIDKAKSSSNDPIEYVYNSEINSLIVNTKYQGKDKLMCLYDNKINYIKDNKCENYIELKDSNILFADINLKRKSNKGYKKRYRVV